MELEQRELRAVTLFFFFVCTHESLTIELSAQAADLFKKHFRPENSKDSNLVQLTKNLYWRNFKKISKARGLMTPYGGTFLLPEGVSILGWRNFLKIATDEELIVLIWVHLLKFSLFDIGIALNLSSGTINYRLSHAIRKLGEVLSYQPIDRIFTGSKTWQQKREMT